MRHTNPLNSITLFALDVQPSALTACSRAISVQWAYKICPLPTAQTYAWV